MSTNIYCGMSESDIKNTYSYISNSITIIGSKLKNIIDKNFIDTLIRINPNINEIKIKSVNIIKNNTFRGLNNLNTDNIKIEFDNNVNELGDFAFYNCKNIREITLPKNITDNTFGVYVFKNCVNLEKVYYDENSKFTVIPEGTFSNSGLKHFIPLGYTDYYDTIFIKLPIQTVNRYAFEYTKASNVIFNSLRAKEYSFRGCKKLDRVTINTIDPWMLKNSSLSKYNFERYLDKKFVIASKRQFRHMKKVYLANEEITEYIIDLNDDFKYCTESDHYMIFCNRRLIPPNSIIVRSEYNTPLVKSNSKIYISIPKEQTTSTVNIEFDIFYIPNSLDNITDCIENSEYTINDNGEHIRYIPNTGYIRFISNMYAKSSKHSSFVFLNGKKIPMSDMEDISNTIIKIMTSEYTGKRLEVYSHIDENFSSIVYAGDGLSHNYGRFDNDYIRYEHYAGRIKRIDMADLESFPNQSLLDKLLNSSPDEKLNLLFDNSNQVTYNEPIKNSNYMSKKTLINKILQDYQTDIDSKWVNNIK